MSIARVSALFFDVLLDKFAACLRRMSVDREKDRACLSELDTAQEAAESYLVDEPWLDMRMNIHSFVLSVRSADSFESEVARRTHLADARYHLDLLRCQLKSFAG